jgi:hypothetical protein
MNLVFEIDRNRLVDAATGAQVSSLQFAYPDKYPLSISVSKGNQPFVFSGNVYVTLKPASSPLSAPLALLTVPVNSSSTVTGVLDTYIQEMDDFLPAANKRAAAFEVLVVAPSATTEVSVSVNAQISRRYNSVDQPGVTVAEKSLATQTEAEAGTNNTKWMSPLRVSQAISALANPLDDTDDLSEGTTNLYFTEARAKSAVADELSEIGSDITELTGKTGQLETDLSTEAQTRAAADSSLSGGLTAESQARAAGDASLQSQIDGKAPSSHTHTAAQITDFASAVVAAAPPTTNASLLTSGTLDEARLSATVTDSLAKADSASQPGHGHTISEVENLTAALAEKATITSVTTVSEALTAEAHARAAADTALDQRLDFLASNLDPAALDSIAEAAASINDLQEQIDGKAPTSHPHPISQVTGLQTALDAKQTIRTTQSFQLQEGDNYLPSSRNTLYLLSGSFTFARIYLPTYLPSGTGPWIGDRIRILWVGVKANANSRIVVNAFAGDGQYPALAHLHAQDQSADFVLDNRPVNESGQLTWRSDVSPIRWVQPPATPTSFVAPNGGVYSPSDVAFDGSYFYIYGTKPDGSPVWLRSPMASTW